MNCYKCGCALNEKSFCTSCGADVAVYKKIVSASNILYNDGLEKAKVRDLSGAVVSLQQCLKCNNNHIEARNLLGLVYFEMGEAVQALNQWVISKNFRPKKNLADDYIEMIQNNPSRLDTISQTVKKYNQALAYCYQDSLDLAVIQLKKVISLNPKYLRARQLLALLYINKEDWGRAKNELVRCQQIDINNTTTLRYLKEVEKMTKPDEGGLFDRGNDNSKYGGVLYQRDNETIIQPASGMKKGKGMGKVGSIINIIIGIILGALVVRFLIVPQHEKDVLASLDTQLKEVSEHNDALNTQVNDLTQRVSELMNDKEDLKNQLELLGGEEGIKGGYDTLLECVGAYLSEESDATQIADIFLNIDENYVQTSASEEYVKMYNTLKEKIGKEASESYYKAGYDYYNNEYFDEAIDVLKKAVFFDDESKEALYLLGNAYRMSDNTEMALEIYSKVVDQFDGTDVAKRAKEYIDTLTLTQ